MPQDLAKPPSAPQPVRANPQPSRARVKPAKRVEKLSATDPHTDPAKRALQRRCHHAYVVDGKSYTTIARELGIERETVSGYVRIEAERRGEIRDASLAAEVDRSIEVYTDAGRRALARMEQPGARGDELRWVIYARERIDRILGIEAAVRVKDETPRAAPLVGTSHEGLTALLQLAIAIKPSSPNGG